MTGRVMDGSNEEGTEWNGGERGKNEEKGENLSKGVTQRGQRKNEWREMEWGKREVVREKTLSQNVVCTYMSSNILIISY